MKSFEEEAKKKDKEKKLLSDAIVKDRMDKRMKSMREQEKTTVKKSHFLARFKMRRSSETQASTKPPVHFPDLADVKHRPRSRDKLLRFWKDPDRRPHAHGLAPHAADRQPQSPGLVLRKSAEQTRHS